MKKGKELQSLEKGAERVQNPKLPPYLPPGGLLPGTGANGSEGSRDFQVYGPIFFPTDTRAAAQTVVYRADQYCLPDEVDDHSECVRGTGIRIKKAKPGDWRIIFARRAAETLTCSRVQRAAGSMQAKMSGGARIGKKVLFPFAQLQTESLSGVFPPNRLSQYLTYMVPISTTFIVT